MTETTIELAVRFRLCRADDLPALEWMGLHTREREVIHAAFAAQERDDGAMLLGCSGGFPVAQAWLDMAETGSPTCPFVWAVRVFPPMQGAGLGDRLMRETERLAARRGAGALELGVEWDNPGARRFYRRLGYRPVGARDETQRYSFEGYPIEAEFSLEIMRKKLPARQDAAVLSA